MCELYFSSPAGWSSDAPTLTELSARAIIAADAGDVCEALQLLDGCESMAETGVDATQQKAAPG